MARKGSQFTDDQLVAMYRRYAKLKGWSTANEVVRDKVQSWRDQSIGPVGLAIDFHETGRDNAKHLGRNAEKSSGVSALVVGFVIVLVVVIAYFTLR